MFGLNDKKDEAPKPAETATNEAATTPEADAQSPDETAPEADVQSPADENETAEAVETEPGTITWVRPSGSEIETNDSDASIAAAEEQGWERK
ncbi:MAG: hypothetical protein KAI73_05025 [Rhodospirillaceae bacterium]|nr:hypothetical protein [Rhodospirillaceae bacterium]